MSAINIVVSASSLYIRYARVMMGSIYANHKNRKINLYVFYLDDKVAAYERELIEQSYLHNKNNTINFIKVDRNLLSKIDNGKGWAIDLWCRWYALDVLANSHDRVLFLGVDTFIRSSIAEFYDQDLSGFYFACAPDMFISNTDSSKWPAIKMDMDRVGFFDKKKYINGDVVLINLSETRKNLSFDKFLSLYNENQFTCWDQDVITYCFADYIKYQNNLEYNYFPNLNLENIHDIDFFQGVKIAHFAGGPKPWNVPPWDSKKFTGIGEWWELAKSEGYPGKIEYIRFCKQFLRKMYNWLRGFR